MLRGVKIMDAEQLSSKTVFSAECPSAQIDLSVSEKQKKHDLHYIYMESKNLFIRGEECLESMDFFVAPIVEHRDALDHIMRYFDIKERKGLTDEALVELDNAKGHELRAYFDIADYICISIRHDIYTALKKASIRKINRVWPEYVQTKKYLVGVSEEIADIRKTRTGSLEYLKKYQDVIEKIFNIYKYFLTEIEPKLKKSSIWR